MTRHMKMAVLPVCAVLAMAITGALPSTSQAESEPAETGLPETFTGRLADTGGALPRAGTTFFTLHIDRYSTEEEMLELLALLQEKGQDVVVDAMWDMEEKGWIKIGNTLGYHAAVIRSFENEGYRIIRVFTDRPIQFVESMRGLRSRDYPFGLIELSIGPDGTGEGVLIAAAKAEFTETAGVEFESYGTQPFKILQIQKEKLNTKKNKK